MPGPHDREGLPPGIRFWKNQIEETDRDRTFSVGVIYGPSGCGKSSLVKAGLLPRLAEGVVPIYVEATAVDTEVRLLKGLRKVAGTLRRAVAESLEASLPELIAAIREGEDPSPKATAQRSVPASAPATKVLIVIDQFEQWLHAQGAGSDSQLVSALRQCDGAAVQCLVLVRDDFWMSVTRFMQALEIPMVEGHNSAAVDLFDPDHARKVLAAFGRAYGKLPDDLSPCGASVPPAFDQQAGRLHHNFLDQAVKGLTQEGKVISVRLALFAEMMKGRPWTPASLEEVGGTEGVGVAFLESTFSAKTAPPTHRLYQEAARKVLKALLPELGTDIKGQMKSRDALLAASGYASRPTDFTSLLAILDGELRLITPTEPDEGSAEGTGDRDQGADNPKSKIANPKWYQLTHDYLVPSIREWLTRKQRETYRGRAELRLAERAAGYSSKPGPRHLPSWWEWPSILLFTRPRNWTDAERRVMRAAARHHLSRSAVVLAVASAVAFALFTVRASMIERQQADLAAGYVKRLLSAETREVAEMLHELAKHRRHAEPALASVAIDTTRSPKARLHAALALLPSDENQANYLAERLLSAAPAELKLIRAQLDPPPADIVARLWEEAVDETAAEGEPFHAAAALAGFDPDDDRWRRIGGYCAEQLISQNALQFVEWLDLFGPAGRHLVAQLVTVIRDDNREPALRTTAANALSIFSADDPSALCQAIVNCEPEQFEVLLPVLAKGSNRQRSLSLLNDMIQGTFRPNWDDPPLDRSWPTAPPAATTKIENAGGFVAERFAYCLTLPLADFAPVASELAKSGYRPTNYRPYKTARGAQVAALWTRDGTPWRTAHDCTQDELQAQDKEHRELGLVPLDVTLYLVDREQQSHEAYAALWGKPEKGMGDYALRFEYEWGGFHDKPVVRTKMWLSLPEGHRECEIVRRWQDLGSATPYKTDFFRTTILYGADAIAKATGLSDIRVIPEPPPMTTAERYTRQRQAALVTLKADPKNNSALFEKAEADLRLGDPAAALNSLDHLSGTEQACEENSTIAYLRAIALIRLGRRDEARDAARLQAQIDRGPTWAEARQLKLSALIADEPHQVDRALLAVEQHAAEFLNDVDTTYQAVCAYALAAEQFAAGRPADAARYRRSGIKWLRCAVAAGFSNIWALANDPEIDALRDEVDFTSILEELKQSPDVGPSYLAVANAGGRYESCEVHGLRVDDVCLRVRELARDEWRPISVSAAVAWRLDEAVAIVLQRPVPSRAAQSAAAAALARLETPETVWPLLIHSPHPDVRTAVIHRLAPLGVDPQLIINRMLADDHESPLRADVASAGRDRFTADVLFDAQTSIRRALLLALGEYSEKQHSAAEHESLLPKLKALYRDDPDAGIHAACGWLLHRWRHGDSVQAIDAEVASSSAVGGRRWYTNRHRQTFSVIHGPVECLTTEQFDEPQRIEIGHWFAIADTEITLAQFKEFRSDHQQYRSTKPQSAAHVSWYDAAAYCNWLSEQEGLDKDHWCYRPNAQGEYAEGMQLADGFLDCSGYRLPTELEWVFACRAGSEANFCFGDDEEALRHYAWYNVNTATEQSPLADWSTQQQSSNRWIRALEHFLTIPPYNLEGPVARKQPNDLGLFNVHGNLSEWCGEIKTAPPAFSPYDDDWTPKLELRLRGGSFSDAPTGVTTFSGGEADPESEFHSGFRVARTLPLGSQTP